MKLHLVTATLLLALASGQAAGAAPTTLKFATILPQGGPWAAAMTRFASDVSRLTRGQVVVKFYFGAVAGTDEHALARMRSGQIQGLAAATASLSGIEPSVRVMELPMLFKTPDEFRYTLRSMQPEFRLRYAAKGYTLLGMAGIGWVRIYSKLPLNSLADFRARKVWRWSTDPMAAALFQVVGVKGLNLSPSEVLPSLQAGTLDTVYGMSHIVHSLQWHQSLAYVLDLRITMAIAGVIMRKDALERLSPAHQKILLERADIMAQELNTNSDLVNTKSMQTMVRSGLKTVVPTGAFYRDLESTRDKVWALLRGKLFQDADLKKVQSLITICRNTSCKP
ncbi:MAG: TRAP transporter substrate-binding protein DctP [Polyangia bacterium]|jgi:TRAP-type C4-dicarboxylate transport system substrate-binding protein|nr:TRAP transporter substrate-binding protein DctP [Polyangia bacterium]